MFGVFLGVWLFSAGLFCGPLVFLAILNGGFGQADSAGSVQGIVICWTPFLLIAFVGYPGFPLGLLVFVGPVFRG